MSEVIPGPKWSGLRELLSAWDGWREYDQIWLPDDDICTNSATISRDVRRRPGAEARPLRTGAARSSYFSHFITMVNRRFYGRWVGFVEIMVPGFSRATLERLLPTLDETDTGWGWGLDSVWPKLLGYEGVGIIDGTPVIHTRPVGAVRDAELRRRVHEESDRLLERYDCRQEHVTLAAFGPDLARLDLSPERLLVEIVEGTKYLVERDPRLLAWITEFQRPPSGWPDYPTAGTP